MLNYTYQTKRIPLAFSLQPGFISKGAKTNRDTIDYRLSYLNLPVLLDVYPNEPTPTQGYGVSMGNNLMIDSRVGAPGQGINIP